MRIPAAARASGRVLGSGPGVHPFRQHLRQVPPAHPAQLLQLGPAGEAVREDHRPFGGFPDRGQQLFLRAGRRDRVVAPCEAEVAREAAAAAGQFAGEARGGAQPAVGAVAEDRVLVAVGLADGRAVEAGGIQSGARRSRDSAKVRTRQARRWARGSSLSSSGRSVRRAAAQLGSRTTTGVPDSSTGVMRSSVRRMTVRARSSWPVETYVRPQQTRERRRGGDGGRVTSRPPPPGPGPPRGPPRASGVR
ncbi:hypothetical protein SGLAM104S_09270 [Streptomyces glaucescens]